MNKPEMEQFYQKECSDAFSTMYEEIFRDIKENEEEVCRKWILELENVFKSTVDRQQKNEIGKLGYIHIVFLRTRLLEGKHQLAVYGYDKNGYFGKEYELGTIDITFFMEKLCSVWKHLHKSSLKYIGKISKTDVKRIILEEVHYFLGIWFSLLRKYRKVWSRGESFLHIEKEQYFRVQFGEYFEPGAVLYAEHREKQEKQVRKKIRRKKQLSGSDFRNCRLDGMEIKEKEMNDTFWEGASLRECRFAQADFCGSVFQNVNMTGCHIKNSFLQETEWKGVNLENAEFEMTFFNEGKKFMKGNKRMEYGPIRFQNCNLQNAAFVASFLDGADFTTSNIDGCTFTKSSMCGCKIRRSQIEHIKINEKQLEDICIVEG